MLILLDHGVFQIQSISLGRYYNILHVRNGADKEIGAERIVSAVEIRRHSPLQILRLSYIDNRTLGIEIHVHSGGGGEDGNLLLQLSRFSMLRHTVITLRTRVRFYDSAINKL